VSTGLALTGGDPGKTASQLQNAHSVTWYGSQNDGGAGELKRLTASIKRGGGA